MALKCGNCRYFVKAHFFGSYCDYKRRMRNRNDLVSENTMACSHFSAIGDYDNGLDNNGTTDDCFLTSACVEYLGKPDNCEELTTLRAFRDTYLMRVSDGENLVKAYYAVAPEIVQAINESAEKNEYYAYIYTVIQKCLRYISDGNFEDALGEYKAMVNELCGKLIERDGGRHGTV